MEGYLDYYEDALEGLFEPHSDWDGDEGFAHTGTRGGSNDAWGRLSKILGEFDDISDSESVGTVGDLGLGDEGNERWEQISPVAITALEEEKQAGAPRSPGPRRRSSGSSSPALRPVIPMIEDEYQSDYSALGDDIPEGSLLDARPHDGPAVDEVEAVFHV